MYFTPVMAMQHFKEPLLLYITTSLQDHMLIYPLKLRNVSQRRQET